MPGGAAKEKPTINMNGEFIVQTGISLLIAIKTKPRHQAGFCFGKTAV
jgi:hypothetical protein